VIGLYDI
jgi:serine/threonine protein kinase